MPEKLSFTLEKSTAITSILGFVLAIFISAFTVVESYTTTTNQVKELKIKVEKMENSFEDKMIRLEAVTNEQSRNLVEMKTILEERTSKQKR